MTSLPVPDSPWMSTVALGGRDPPHHVHHLRHPRRAGEQAGQAEYRSRTCARRFSFSRRRAFSAERPVDPVEATRRAPGPSRSSRTAPSWMASLADSQPAYAVRRITSASGQWARLARSTSSPSPSGMRRSRHDHLEDLVDERLHRRPSRRRPPSPDGGACGAAGRACVRADASSSTMRIDAISRRRVDGQHHGEAASRGRPSTPRRSVRRARPTMRRAIVSPRPAACHACASRRARRPAGAPPSGSHGRCRRRPRPPSRRSPGHRRCPGGRGPSIASDPVEGDVAQDLRHLVRVVGHTRGAPGCTRTSDSSTRSRPGRYPPGSARPRGPRRLAHVALERAWASVGRAKRRKSERMRLSRRASFLMAAERAPPAPRRVSVSSAREQRRGVHDRGQRITDLVRDPGGQLTGRGQALGLGEAGAAGAPAPSRRRRARAGRPRRRAGAPGRSSEREAAISGARRSRGAPARHLVPARAADTPDTGLRWPRSAPRSTDRPPRARS